MTYAYSSYLCYYYSWLMSSSNYRNLDDFQSHFWEYLNMRLKSHFLTSTHECMSSSTFKYHHPIMFKFRSWVLFMQVNTLPVSSLSTTLILLSHKVFQCVCVRQWHSCQSWGTRGSQRTDESIAIENACSIYPAVSQAGSEGKYLSPTHTHTHTHTQGYFILSHSALPWQRHI